MPFPDPCDKCGAPQAEYIVLLEGDYDPTKSETKKLCGNCLVGEIVIEAWSWAEWVNDE